MPVEQLRSHKSNFRGGQEVTKVFSDGLDAGDIHQGALGDCYLLSAMSVLAH